MQECPYVLLIDDGELDDLAELIQGLGIRPERLLQGAERCGWRQPERLLVVSGGRAIRLPHPQAEVGELSNYTKIAVVDQPSRTLQSQIERMGFDFVVYRPTHPEALRLLIASVLHRGREQRTRPRFPVGCEVSWRSGLRQRRGTLTEISASGCRLLMRRATRPRSLSLLFPRDLTGGKALRITGTVVRSERQDGDLIALSMVFDPSDQGRLASFIRSVESGPPSLAA